MRTYPVSLAGAVRYIHFYEGEQDREAFRSFIEGTRGSLVALDTETTGLNPYVPGFQLRTVQFGTKEEAWVIPYETGAQAIQLALLTASGFIIHNASYDLKVLDVVGLMNLDEGWNVTVDTTILAHIVDPRLKADGGKGRKLEDLANGYFADDAELYQKELLALFKANKWSKDVGFSAVSIEEPVYIRYAGWDVLLTAWLYEALAPLVKARFSQLSAFEHEVARLVCGMEKRGILVDTEYASELVGYYQELETEAVRTAKEFGIENLNSVAQQAAVLTALGADLVEKTPTGKPKVDKAVLVALQENNPSTPLATVAQAIHAGKNASKWSVAYVQGTLSKLDSSGRVHPQIRALEARTARMSVSEPPLQQLPSGDWRVRRMFLADPGQLMFSVDYSQVELRVLAALSREPKMLAAIRNGEDLHDTTATLLYGSEFTKAQRKLAKNTNFGEVFGGGAVTLARQAGVSLAEAKNAKALFKKSYPTIGRYSYGLREAAQFGKAAVVTPSGRELPLDRDRLYSATNYVVQSTARDVLCQALIDLDQAGLSGYLLLPVHDEVVGQAPEADVEEIVRQVAEVMTMDFLGSVVLAAEGEVLGRSWGHGYGAEG